MITKLDYKLLVDRISPILEIGGFDLASKDYDMIDKMRYDNVKNLLFFKYDLTKKGSVRITHCSKVFSDDKKLNILAETFEVSDDDADIIVFTTSSEMFKEQIEDMGLKPILVWDTTVKYDGDGKPIHQISIQKSADGLCQLTKGFENGIIKSEHFEDSSKNYSSETTYEYNDNGDIIQQVSHTIKDGDEAKFEIINSYNNENKILSNIRRATGVLDDKVLTDDNAVVHQTNFTYDFRGRMCCETHILTDSFGAVSLNYVRAYDYPPDHANIPFYISRAIEVSATSEIKKGGIQVTSKSLDGFVEPTNALLRISDDMLLHATFETNRKEDYMKLIFSYNDKNIIDGIELIDNNGSKKEILETTYDGDLMTEWKVKFDKKRGLRCLIEYN